jgi:hypothetical protein
MWSKGMVCLASLAACLVVAEGAPAQEIAPAPTPELTPAPPVIELPIVRPMSLGEFAANFQPAPGTYEVLLLHPKTGCPVSVTFTLPCGCPRRVVVTRREVVFDYGREKVVIRFPILGGGVRVAYR